MSAEVAPSSVPTRGGALEDAVIDVDDFDDEIQFMGMRRSLRSQRREPPSPEVAVVPSQHHVHFDDDRLSRPGPSRRRDPLSPPPAQQSGRTARRHNAHRRPASVSDHPREPRHNTPVVHPAPADGRRPIGRTYAWIADVASTVFRRTLGGGRDAEEREPSPEPLIALHGLDREMIEHMLRGREGDEVADAFLAPFERMRYVFGMHGRGANAHDGPRGPDYKPEFTHAGLPEKGFTFDFAAELPPKGESQDDPMVIDDEDLAGAPLGPLPLLCASCQNHLFLDAAGETDEVMRRMARVWALRCGHMIDGVCLENLSKPADERLFDVKGKGKMRADDADVKGKRKGSATRSVDIKGKGKAKAESVFEDSEVLAKAAPEAIGQKRKRGNEPEPEVQIVDVPGGSEMRSRLRPRASMTASTPGFYAQSSRALRRGTSSASMMSDIVPTSTAPLSTGPGTSSIASPVRPTRSNSRVESTVSSHRAAHPTARPTSHKAAAKGKGKGKTRASAVEAEHCYLCPVNGCRRQHASQLIDGKWVQHPGRGAVAMYV